MEMGSASAWADCCGTDLFEVMETSSMGKIAFACVLGVEAISNRNALFVSVVATLTASKTFVEGSVVCHCLSFPTHNHYHGDQ